MRAAWIAQLSLAFLMTLLSLLVQDSDVEVASYGSEGNVADYLYPRPVAGWPAPFLADNPGTSVILQLGVEDNFRLWPFVADVGFWCWVVFLASKSGARIVRRKHP